MIAKIVRKLTGEVFYLDVPESAICETKSSLFPAKPEPEDLAKLLSKKPSGYESICAGILPATKCTALGVNRRDNYLSILASGSGNLFYTLRGVNGTATPNGGDSKKLFEMLGYDIPSALGGGKATYGGFYGNLPNGGYILSIYDDANGVNSYPLTLTDSAPLMMLKSTFSSGSGGNSGGSGGTGGGGSTGGGTGTPISGDFSIYYADSNLGGGPVIIARFEPVWNADGTQVRLKRTYTGQIPNGYQEYFTFNKEGLTFDLNKAVNPYQGRDIENVIWFPPNFNLDLEYFWAQGPEVNRGFSSGYCSAIGKATIYTGTKPTQTS